MAHKDRKTRKKRGTRTCGHGSTKKHRGAGSRGGRGMAGSKKHKWSFISKNDPDYFGRSGFKRPPSVTKKIKTINIQDIEEHFEKLLDEGKIEKKGKTYKIDLDEMGYDKLLGTGNPKHKFVINVDSYSDSALSKIEESGGKIEGVEQEK